MPINVNVHIIDTYSQRSLSVEKEEAIKSIFPNYNEYGITEKDFGLLEKVAKLSGDPKTLEFTDIALLNLGKCSNDGNLKYEESDWKDKLFCFFDTNGLKAGDKIIVTGLNMTLGQAEKYFNLPKEALKHDRLDKSAPYEDQPCRLYTVIPVDVFLKNNPNVSKELLKELCK